MSRRDDLNRLYGLLAELQRSLGGTRLLRDSAGRSGWPTRGVYFFFEPGELREDGRTPRVVRVGTHAVSTGSKTTLWQRLALHRGRTAGGGNHRASVFRRHIGGALLATKPEEFTTASASWSRLDTASRHSRPHERELEYAVSSYLGNLPFLWLAVDDPPGRSSLRHTIECNTVALLSNAHKPPIDPPSPAWLGRNATNPAIAESGLWNVDFVYDTHDPAALDVLEEQIRSL
jgi:hypothetical protein